MRLPLAAAAAILVAAFATPARADTPAPAGDKAAAQALFEKGRELVEKGRFADACPKLAESQRLDPGLGTLLWLADCLENNGQTASAWASFTEAAALAHQAHDKRERIARDRSKKLEPRLARIVVLVPPGSPQGVVVERDGTALGAAEWGVAVPVDPGEHTIAASAAGFARWTTTVQLPARPETLRVTVPPLEAAPSAPPAPAPAAAPAPSPAPPPAQPSPSIPPAVDATPAPPTDREAPPDPASSSRGDGQRTLGLAVAGLGLLSLGAGAYFSLAAKSTYDDATSSGHCNASNACDPTGKQQRSDAYSQATVATVTLAAGAGALAAGAVLYLTAPRGMPVKAALAPTPRGGSAWVTVDW